MQEFWVDVLGYEGLYQVSSFGRVKSLERFPVGKDFVKRRVNQLILKPTLFNNGYFAVSLRRDDKTTKFSVHRLVALSFIPNPENKPQVNHKNGIKSDNGIDNLEWATSSENINHALKNGLIRDQSGDERPWWRGEKNPVSVLNDNLVHNIRGMYSNGVKMTEIAKVHNLNYSTVRSVCYKQSWKHI